MHVAIDISQIVYGTGVSRYIRELVINLLDLKPDLQLTAFAGVLRKRKELASFTKRLPRTKSTTFPIPPTALHHLWNTLHILPIDSFIGKVDLIHTSDWAEPPSKIPKITTVHDLNFLKDPKFASGNIRQVHRKRLYWVARECKKIIAVSQATKNDLLNFYDIPPERIEVIYEGPTMEAPTSTSPSIVEPILRRYGIEKPYMLVPGSGHPRKNLRRIVNAFKPFADNHHLVVIGRPSADEMSLKTKNLHFTGFVSDQDLPYLFSQAELLLYPSLYEGFGLPILDAFACSTPVVTSNTSSLPEVAGTAAVLVDPEDTSAITQGIEKALKNTDKLIQLGAQQLKLFSWEKTAKETYNVYKAAINK